MEEKDKNKTGKKSAYYFTGIGLVFGTAVGAGLSLAITGTVVWAGIGTGAGLIIGAIIDGYKKDKPEE